MAVISDSPGASASSAGAGGTSGAACPPGGNPSDPHGELTEHERSIFAVEQEFARMVSGARRAMRGRAIMMHPDLLPFDFKVVGALWHHDPESTGQLGLTSRELTELLASDKSMISRSLKRLDEIGFIVRETDPQDARVQRIHLTDEAATKYRETGKEQRRVVQDRLRTWDLEQVQQLGQLLLKLNGPWPECANAGFPVAPPNAAAPDHLRPRP